MHVHPDRVHRLTDKPDAGGPVLYWMSREQRARDNWPLLYARQLAGGSRPLVVGFCLVPSFLGATLRQYDFMLRGLEETASRLADLGIPFALRLGAPGEEIPRLAAQIGAGVVVTDFDPLRIKRQWQAEAARTLSVPLVEVDGHNVVPCRKTSDKQEYAARTIRPKIHRQLNEFLEEFPDLASQDTSPPDLSEPDWERARRAIDVNSEVAPVPLAPGEDAAAAALSSFLTKRLRRYAEQRNDPNADATSGLSAYLHFGHLAPQRAALDAAATGGGDNQQAFLEELIVRRELTDNFCHYNPHYDSLDGAPDWAVKTLNAHRDDQRPHLYTLEQFAQARTHSALWNAAQNQLRSAGYMHGYMRMFWAKKILEWSDTPENALATAIRLNDTYQLDGRDPNGYVGCLWSIAGVHDRPWKERPVYGSVRYMNENGCRRKFDVKQYIARWNGGEQGSLL